VRLDLAVDGAWPEATRDRGGARLHRILELAGRARFDFAPERRAGADRERRVARGPRAAVLGDRLDLRRFAEAAVAEVARDRLDDVVAVWRARHEARRVVREHRGEGVGDDVGELVVGDPVPDVEMERAAGPKDATPRRLSTDSTVTFGTDEPREVDLRNATITLDLSRVGEASIDGEIRLVALPLAGLSVSPFATASASRKWTQDIVLKLDVAGPARIYDVGERTSATGAVDVDPAIPGFNYDIVAGVDYTIDVSKPIGNRITTLEFEGRPVAPNDSFTMALNNYRQTGGGGFSMLRNAPVVYDRQLEIRQLLIDEVRRKGTIQPSDYFHPNWRIVPPSAIGQILKAPK